jgi:hypothetical protein
MIELEVRNPVARLSAATVPRARRLESLDGASLGLWWNKKVGGEVALEWLSASFRADYDFQEKRFYGKYPAAPRFLDEAAGASTAVIGATADCGSCTSWLIHDLIEIERRGVPAVALVAQTFVADARQSANVFGLPDLAMAVLPRGLTNLSPEEIIVLARAARDDVIGGLTGSYRGPSQSAATLPSPDPRLFSYRAADHFAVLDQFQSDFLDRGVGDGFPLVPPTQAAVENMVRGTGLPADEVVAVLEPAMGIATVEMVAVNAVLAGCKPEHLPVLLAAVEAIAAPEYALRGVAMSTGAHNPLIVANGPYATSIGMNSGRGALGPGRQSAVNTVIGRALRLVMMNIGYAYVGIFDLDTIGTPRKYSMCLAENEPASPWEPLHVERGLRAEDSAVTVFSVESELETQDLDNHEGERLLRTFAGNAQLPGGSSVQHTYLEPAGTGDGYELHNLMLICPEHAAILAREGWTKQQVKEFVYRESAREVRWTLNAVNPGAMRDSQRWALDKGPNELIPVMAGPEALHICVVGGAAGKSQYLPGIGNPVTRSIARYLP